MQTTRTEFLEEVRNSQEEALSLQMSPFDCAGPSSWIGRGNFMKGTVIMFPKKFVKHKLLIQTLKDKNHSSQKISVFKHKTPISCV